MTIYTYSRFSPRNPDFQQDMEALIAAFPDATHIEDSARGRMPAMERPDFVALVDTLQSGDTLAVNWLSSISKDFQQCQHVLQLLMEKNVTLKTTKPAMTVTPGSETAAAIALVLEGYGQADTRHRLHAAEMGRRALREDGRAWKEKFRGRPANKEKHMKIAGLLLEGKTLEEVAQICDCSLSTVKRVKSRVSEHDDEGALRRRGHGRHGHHRHGMHRGDHRGEGRGEGRRHRGRPTDSDE
ncbi:recombinase family protein [Vibrio fluvialis]|nr:recombinase family protein [Vibrio fluvialis]EKO3999326.1 recombinase family protein [Vibrio fluvialis]